MNNPPTHAAHDTPTSSALATTRPAEPIVLNQSLPWQLRLEPNNITETLQLAALFAEQGIFNIKSPAEAVAKIMFGSTLGMSAAASLTNVNMIEGRPSLEAATILGICLQRRDVCELFEKVSSSPTAATWRGKRAGYAKVLEVTFTIEDAERAGLIGRGDDERAKKMNNWNRYPEDMCNARAIVRVARQLFADLIRGFASADDIRDRILDQPSIETTGTSAPDGTPAAVVQVHAGRDFGVELAAFKARAVAARNAEEMAPLREELGKLEGTPILAECKRAYNDRVKEIKKSAAAAPTPEAPKVEEKKAGES